MSNTELGKIMNLLFSYKICKILSLYYILFWINSLDGQPLTNISQSDRNLTHCVPNFETNVQQCLNGLYFYRQKADILKFQTSRNLFKEILKRFFCRQYTNSLQCIHETLDGCETEETTRIVQSYLSQTWAHHYNAFCDINQQNSYFFSKENSTVTLSPTTKQKTENSTIRTIKIPIRESNRTLQTTKGTENSTTDNIQLKNKYFEDKRFSNQMAEATEIFSKNTLFYSRAAKTEKSFKGKQSQTVEYNIMFQKLASKKIKMLMKSAIINNQKHKSVANNFEIMFEIQ